MRISTLLLCVAALSAPLATAQDLTVERDGAEITITRPDGTVERFTVDEATPLRVRVKDGPLLVEREGEEDGLRRRIEVERRGDGPAVWFEGGDDDERPRAFAFRMRPGEAPFDVEKFDIEMDADSVVHRMVRRRGRPGAFDMAFEGEGFAPWPGFGERGVTPETRRSIAEGERASRDLASRLRRAEGAERERPTRELRDTLERTFDFKQQSRRERIEHLQQDAERLQGDLSKLNDEVAEREKARREIIERRQRELLGEGSELDW